MARGKRHTGTPDAAAKLRASEREKAKDLIAQRRAELAALEAQGKRDEVLETQLGEAQYDYDRGASWSAIGRVSDEGIAYARTIS